MIIALSPKQLISSKKKKKKRKTLKGQEGGGGRKGSSGLDRGGRSGGGGVEMNGGEKWSMLSYMGGSQDKTVINRVMLRFRPIAPKPVAGGPGSGGGQFDNKNLLICKPRAKRKYVRVRKNNIKRKKRSSSSSSDHLDEEASSKDPDQNIVTLQLLPEKTEGNGSIDSQNGAVLDQEYQGIPMLFNLNLGNHRWIDRVEELDRTVVESWMTVESVTDTCMGGRELGCTDVERMKNLEADTCPGFISDGLNRVEWVNGAYKRMLAAAAEEEIKVWLVMKKELPRFCTAFSCKVRLQYYTWQKEKCSRVLPCDVWRMDGGGFAWRLDVEAALSLGR